VRDQVKLRANKQRWNAKNGQHLATVRNTHRAFWTGYRERSMAFLDYLESVRGLYPELLSRQTGMNSSVVSKLRQGKYGFTTAFLCRLLPACPELNVQWLFYGDGPMLRRHPGTNFRKAQA
jgi:hypothetical protein